MISSAIPPAGDIPGEAAVQLRLMAVMAEKTLRPRAFPRPDLVASVLAVVEREAGYEAACRSVTIRNL